MRKLLISDISDLACSKESVVIALLSSQERLTTNSFLRLLYLMVCVSCLSVIFLSNHKCLFSWSRIKKENVVGIPFRTALTISLVKAPLTLKKTSRSSRLLVTAKSVISTALPIPLDAKPTSRQEAINRIFKNMEYRFFIGASDSGQYPVSNKF